MTKVHKKVLFPKMNDIYWLHQTARDTYNLSPISHYSEDGVCFASDDEISFAIVLGDKILRYGSVIGKMSDLIDVTDDISI